MNPVLGIKFLNGEEDLDFMLPGVVPLHWQRSYFSDLVGNGWLGQGWSLPFSLCLKQAANSLLLIDSQGNETGLPTLGPGECRTLRDLGLHVCREANGRYRLVSADHGTHHVFAPLAASAADPRGERAGEWPLVCIADRCGRHIRLLYDEAGWPVRIHDAAGRVLDLQHTVLSLADGNAVQRLQRVMLGGEVLVSYEYSCEGDLVCVRNAEGEITREYRYNNHILIGHSQPGALAARYEYDRCTPAGKVLRIENNVGQVWRFRYLPGRTEVSDALGQTTSYLFNDDGAVVGLVDAAGNTSRIDVDGRGNPARVTDAVRRVRLTTYDARGNMTSLTDAGGARVEIQYHPRWQQPVLMRDASGAATRLEYDDAGNLVRRTDALGHATEYAWDEGGCLVRITDAHGRQQHFGYDEHGQVTSHTDCSGQTTRYGRDEWGFLSSKTNAAGETTRYRRDRRGRPLEIVRPDGSHEVFRYDVHGRLIEHVDARGARTRWEWAADGLLVARIDALGHRISHEYDAVRRLRRLVNENGAQYRFAYDAAGRLVEEQGFDGRLIRYRRDAAGQLEERLEFGMQAEHAQLYEGCPVTLRTTYERDRAGRVIATTITRAGDGRVERSTWRYDAAGRMVEAGNDCCRVERGYDARGQLVSETCHVDGRTLRLTYGHDALGNHTVTTLPDGHRLNYLYYGPGRLHQINLDGEVISDIERDALHREVSRTQGRLVSHYRYDCVGRRVAQRAVDRFASAGDAAPVIWRTYGYDPAGNVLEVNERDKGLRRYRYDLLGQMIQADGETFAFDAAHNLLDGAQAHAVTNNRLGKFAGWSFLHDTHGNVIEKALGARSPFGFDYSLKHQIERAHTLRAGDPQQVEYGYDVLGRRVYKKSNSGTTLFVWQGNRLLAEIGGNRTRVYVYGHNSFVPLAQIESGNDRAKKATIRYYHTDQVGLPRELTDENGRVQWHACYGAWGRVQEERGADGVHQPLRFQGQYHDAETGLHYNRHRYYDPDVGRFVTQDPIGLKGDINLYRYAPNPARWIDPLGLYPNMNLFPPGDLDIANAIIPLGDYYSVAGHGLPGILRDETGSSISPEQLAHAIRNDNNFRQGQRIVLFACHTGSGGENSYAQRLANESGSTVTAPDGEMWMTEGNIALAPGANWLSYSPG